MADKLFPGRWIHYMNLDYRNWDQPDFAQQAVRQVEEGHRRGAAGFKQEKSLGLFLRDGQGKLLKVDDPRLDPMWERLGELNMPVSIHTGDPKDFFEPYNDRNERWKELKDHPRWWFGDTNKYPTFHALLDSITRVIARHPRTTFVCVLVSKWVSTGLSANTIWLNLFKTCELRAMSFVNRSAATNLNGIVCHSQYPYIENIEADRKSTRLNSSH